MKLLTMCLIKFSKNITITPNEMDELFWGKDMEDSLIGLKGYRWLVKFENWMKKSFSRLQNSN